MDTSPTPGQKIRLLLDINRAPDGRLEGQIRAHGIGTWKPFSGVLELLKVLKEHLATYFALDVAHVRIILVTLSFLAGAAVPLYLAAWLLIPAEGSGTAIADEVLNHAGSHSS
jgi:hypothetical protein